METKTKTIGEAAEQKAQEYLEVYKQLRKNLDRKQSYDLAKYDILVESIVSEIALKKLDELIRGVKE